MANRYQYTKIKKDKRAKNRVHDTTFYPKIVEEENDIYMTTRFGDRLDILAHRYYNDSSMWWVIAQANNIEGTLFVEVGVQLRIPQVIQKIYGDLEDINNNL